MADDAVRRTDAVQTLPGFAGRHPDQPQSRQQDGNNGQSERAPRPHDEVCVRADALAALRLLRERVLACTRRELGVGQVSVPMFAEVVEHESVEDFLSRLISDQNQLAARAVPGEASRQRLSVAFEAGVIETRQLVAEVHGDGAAVIDQVATEFARRLAELDS